MRIWRALRLALLLAPWMVCTAQVQPPASDPQASSGALPASASSTVATGNASAPSARTRQAPSGNPLATGSKAVPAKAPANGSWARLTPAQQQALQPLAPIWHEINGNRRSKWIALSANFSRMSAADQATLQNRMRDWASLSATERNRARLNFAQTRELTPQQKKSEWQAYQALSPERKKQLAASAARATPGAAPGVTQVAPGKLAAVPVTRSHSDATAADARAAKPAQRRASAPAAPLP